MGTAPFGPEEIDIARRRKRSRRARSSGAGTKRQNVPQDRPRRPLVDLAVAAGLTLLAWVHRLAFLQSNRDRDWPFSVFYQGDSETFFRYAQALLRGELHDDGIPFHPPGFPTFLAVLHKLLGADAAAGTLPSHFEVKAVLALVASLAVGLLYLLAHPYLGRLAALLAALLCTYHFGLYVIAVATVSEGLYLTMLLAALLLWSRAFEHPLAAPGSAASRPLISGLILGSMLGLLALVRAESMLLAALLAAVGVAGWLPRARAERRAGKPWHASAYGLAPWILVAVGWTITVAPWTARNYDRLGAFNERMGERLAEPLPRLVPVTIYGPLNLALANSAEADGSFSPDALMAGTGASRLDLAQPEHLRYLLHGDAIAHLWIRDNPAAFARLVVKKWRLALGAMELGWTQWNLPGGLVGIRRPVDVFVPDSSPTLWLLPLLTLAGLGCCLSAPGGPRRWALLVLLLSGAGLFTTGLFFGYARQGLLLLPFWLSLIAAGAVWLGARRRAAAGDRAPLPSRVPRRLAAALAAAAVLLLALEGWGSKADRNYEASGTTGADGHQLNPDDTVRLEVMPDAAAGAATAPSTRR